MIEGMSRKPFAGLRAVAMLAVAVGMIGQVSVSVQTPDVLINHAVAGNHGGSPALWIVRATDHFDIYYQRHHERALDDIGREAERAYARVSFDLRHDLARKMPLILFRTERELPRDRRGASEIVRASGAAPDRDHLLLALEPSDGRATALVHELTHQFAFEIIPLSTGAPTWAREAFPDQEAGTWNSSDLVTLREAAAIGAIPAVERFADSDRLWGHALLDFVVAEYGREGLRRYLTALRNTSSPADSRATFGITASDFDRAFQTYVSTRFNR